MGGGEGGGTTLEYTPTWVVAGVCSVIVIISLLLERFLHYLGKLLKKKKQKPLFEALLKIKEELMLLGFISLLLTVFQDGITTICISEELANKWLPCKKVSTTTETDHLQTFFSGGSTRRLLDESSDSPSSCDKVPILSITALHHLHIFIFFLACLHVAFCALTILFGMAKIRQWKKWEDLVSNLEYDLEQAKSSKFTHVREHDFIKKRFMGIGKNFYFMGWVHSFFKQFYVSVNRSDYNTLRLGFIATHCRGNPKFNFHKYMVRALEADFKKVVGISWYLWLFVVIFLLLNVAGWEAYFWIAFIPFFLLLAVGTKLEHIINELAHEVAEKHIAITGDLVVQPSDAHFWFHKPQIVIILIHIILFQNSFELAFLFWIWVQYGIHSCILGDTPYIIPRLIIGAFVQFVCSYSTLPLYAIVTQMGTSFKKAIFDEHIREGLVVWAKQAKKKTVERKGATASGSSQVASQASTQASSQASTQVSSQASTQVSSQAPTLSSQASSQVTSQVGKQEDSPGAVQLARTGSRGSKTEEREAGDISHEADSDRPK
ncbi:MLO-like protein 1 isoform X2 [Manihot esculenta]|uniref:MLO-like protein 1 isoform X2 n=1 Tax=Manihot esculenta TaxID=3983 RepID=UPI001CC4DCF5|nr:MLO-like protein 1 isoform X2 [Manihot esculenta]